MMGLQIGWDCISFCRALVPSSSPLMGADDDGLPLMSTECDPPPLNQARAREFAQWLRSNSPSAVRARAYGPQHYRTCAVVGSGHDLRCGVPRGAEIDAHDAVFRSNAAQHGEAMGGFDPAQARALRRQRLPESQASGHPLIAPGIRT